MNDEAVTEGELFDPAANGWDMIEPRGFGELAGPLWRRGDGRFGFVAAKKHLNFLDIVHGGMLAMFVDQAMGMTGLQATGEKPHATIELNIQFISAARLGDFVEAHCEVVRRTRAILFMQSKMLVGPRIVATATGIWKIRGEK